MRYFHYKNIAKWKGAAGGCGQKVAKNLKATGETIKTVVDRFS